MSKVYLSVPVIVNRDLEVARKIAKIIEDVGCEIISYWVLLLDPDEKLTELDVFKRDTAGVRKCDVLVAEVSKPSHGVGMEIMLAYALEKVIVCTYRKGTRLSWMIKGLPSAKLVEYEAFEDLEKKLTKILSC
ncbi:MAG: nucleoside 2-deoxyribosyltransferase [Candidatus Bathyarchaeia archaeon]